MSRLLLGRLPWPLSRVGLVNDLLHLADIVQFLGCNELSPYKGRDSYRGSMPGPWRIRVPSRTSIDEPQMSLRSTLPIQYTGAHVPRYTICLLLYNFFIAFPSSCPVRSLTHLTSVACRPQCSSAHSYSPDVD